MSVIPQTPRVSGGLRPPGPLPGLCLGPAGDLKRSPDPSPTHAPLTTNPGSAPAYSYFCYILTSFRYRCANILDVYLSFVFVCTVSLTLVSDPTSRRFIRWLLFQTFIYYIYSLYIYIYYIYIYIIYKRLFPRF